jgi:C-8 sterol isomerase
VAHVFNPDDLHAVAKAAVGLGDRDAACAHIVAELKRNYPRHVRDDIPWIFNNAGGAMGQMKLLHASFSEYILLFGTPIGTEGHSGRYATEVWDFVFDGEMWCYEEGDLSRRVYQPGDGAHLGKGRAKGYRVPDSALMLEYARGPIALMFPFGLADSVLSTIDLRTAARTMSYAGKLMLGQLFRGKV